MAKYKWLKSEKTGLATHQNKWKGVYRQCSTLESCAAEYKKSWQFVADEWKQGLIALPNLIGRG